MNREDYIKKLRDNKNLFEKQYNVHSMRIFGSVARNENRPDSDVDVIVEMEPNLYLQIGLKQYLERILGCNVDVLRKHQHMDAFLLKRIENEGITIFN